MLERGLGGLEGLVGSSGDVEGSCDTPTVFPSNWICEIVSNQQWLGKWPFRQEEEGEPRLAYRGPIGDAGMGGVTGCRLLLLLRLLLPNFRHCGLW